MRRFCDGGTPLLQKPFTSRSSRALLARQDQTEPTLQRQVYVQRPTALTLRARASFRTCHCLAGLVCSRSLFRSVGRMSSAGQCPRTPAVGARRARPNGGLLLRVPLRGHPPSFPGLVSDNSRPPQAAAFVGAGSTFATIRAGRLEPRLAWRIETAAPSRATSLLLVSSRRRRFDKISPGREARGSLQSEREEETRD